MGKFPVWSVYMVPSFWLAMVAPTNSSTCSTSSLGGLKSVFSSSVGFRLDGLVVDRMPLRVRFMCPLAVAVDSGRYFWTRFDVIFGKQMSWSLSMALQNVSSVGEKRHWCMNWIVSAIVEE